MREKFNVDNLHEYSAKILSFTAYLWTLFSSAFISSTILPGGSEALVVYGMSEFQDKLWVTVIIATLGNTLGALVTYGMGRLIPNKKQDSRSLVFLQKYGIWTLLFSWVPVVGDGFCLGAGWLRMNAAASALLILIGKFARYLVLAAVSLKIFS